MNACIAEKGMGCCASEKDILLVPYERDVKALSVGFQGNIRRMDK